MLRIVVPAPQPYSFTVGREKALQKRVCGSVCASSSVEVAYVPAVLLFPVRHSAEQSVALAQNDELALIRLVLEYVAKDA